MRVVLDIATILGGAAALIFFWDRFSVLRSRVAQRVSSQRLPSTPQLRFSSLEKHQIPTIIYCSIWGVGLGIVGGKFGYEGLMLSAFLGLVPPFVGVIPSLIVRKVNDWKLYEDFGTMLLFGGVFIFCWGDLLALFSIAVEATSGFRFSGLAVGLTLSVLGGIVGALSGERLTNYSS